MLLNNVAKSRLLSGKIAFGLGVRHSRTVDIARAAKAAGYHYLFIDLEHCTMDIATAGQICVAALDAGVTPVVRVPGHEHFHAARILDGGAQGIVVPHVETAAQARQAVSNCRYAPLGHRSGMGPMVHLHWKGMPQDQISEAINNDVLLVVMLESPRAVENVEEIAAVEGIDVISIGTNDLALEMGIPGQVEHPRILECYDRVAAACKNNNKILRLGGIYEHSQIMRTIELGSRMIMLGNDFGFMMQAMRGKAEEISSQVDVELIS
ncbi:HpcH/HpaI aldolase family protein [Pelagibacterium lacus]|uniref:Aldolase n=1 Tax=Pelagibacterium lacus TaxID=2282655 RepID=A0A369W1H9_9HYPH|nr:aldolase/citrate lyase family protein [Pelagibacterium lacus]RDE07889.1 aldolase [Pelagibacterium lacus]